MNKRLQKLKELQEAETQFCKDIMSVLSNIQLPGTVFDYLFKKEMDLRNKLFLRAIKIDFTEQKQLRRTKNV